MLNIFYAEPEDDRWLPFDRYPRRIVRRIIRGKPRPGGHMRVFLNLRAGLDLLGVPYRVNDYRHALSHPEEVACIVGKPFVLDKIEWRNPILFGAAVHSHPIDDPQLLQRLPIRKILVPGPWMEDMCRPYWGDAVKAWPVGIDTELWLPVAPERKSVDVLLYDKVRWDHELYETILIEPIRHLLRQLGRSFVELRYGNYREEDFLRLLRTCRTMVFLCEHETQGIAYQQALSSCVPILAWDRAGPWRDPSYYPHRVVYEPVTSVPYWDERCGAKFRDASDFREAFGSFWDNWRSERYQPRHYVLENLTLRACAARYLQSALDLR